MPGGMEEVRGEVVVVGEEGVEVAELMCRIGVR